MEDLKIPAGHRGECQWTDLDNVYPDKREREKKKADSTAGSVRLCEGK